MTRPLFNLKYVQTAIYLAVLVTAMLYGLTQSRPTAKDHRRQAIDRAMFDETEFFGATAFVPFPASVVRENLAKVAAEYPGDREILLKIAEFDEALGRDEDAERTIIETGDQSALAAFYNRRGNYLKQAATLAGHLVNASDAKRRELLKELLAVARRHDLRDYLGEQFYEKTAADYPDNISVIAELIASARTGKNPALATRLLDLYRDRFPSSRDFFLLQKAEILTETGRIAEAERLFIVGFDPLWSELTSNAFYDFLRSNGRLRDYRTGLRREFRADPTSFTLAIRLIHLEMSEENDIGNVIDSLESARLRQNVSWTSDELLTVSQLLVEAGDAERAARFIYSLSLQKDLDENDEVKRRVLYQLFRIVVMAEDQSLAISAGDLGFFKTVATADTRPGIATGLISLIFSDAEIGAEFDGKQRVAVKLFNRAAAHRIFTAFKAEFPDSPQLAQMYVDLIRIQTGARNFEVAKGLLVEFDQTKLGYNDFPDAAVKLAEGYFNIGDFTREREVYALLLDHLGRSGRPRFTAPEADSAGSKVFYGGVLDRLIASFSRDKMFGAIAAIYASESEKYPDDSRLAEHYAAWLTSNGRSAELEKVYRRAISRFPDKSWRDRFARWLIAERRSDEFAKFAATVVEGFNDAETRDFLTEFVDNKALSTTSADGRLYAAMYASALERFPHDPAFVKGLLKFYRENKLDDEWRKLSGRYFFESTEVRAMFLDDLAKRGQLRQFLEESANRQSPVYGLFRAEAATRLSDFETAQRKYTNLAEDFPQFPEFTESSIALSRSLGQTDRAMLARAATLATAQSERLPSDASVATRAGEINAELGDCESARRFWHRVRETAAGEDDAHLETAAVFWDYFQYDEALAAIRTLREKRADQSLFAFETGAIHEAKRDRAAATEEYLKVLEAPPDEVSRRNAMDRLGEFLARAKTDVDAAFERRKAASNSPFRLSFNYSDVYFRAGNRDTAMAILRDRVAVEKSTGNLLEAKRFFGEIGETAAFRETLNRIAETAERPRDAIAARLQLAESCRENGDNRSGAAQLEALLRLYPSNYGVIREVESFYWEIGKRSKTLEVLHKAAQRANGKYFYRLRRKLAARLVADGKINEAVGILGAFAARDPLDQEVFQELSDVFVRVGRPESLKELLDRSIAAFKSRNPGPREFGYFVNDLRREAIRAFTRLKRFDLAAEQFVEIINLAPADDENVGDALAFAERYGGTDALIEYYENTARASYKNYRWNVVLARLYTARGEPGRAAENLRTAIFNQPEMPELHEKLAEIYVQTGDFTAALGSFDKVVELAGEDENVIRRRAFVLEKLGRKDEANSELAKLAVPIAGKGLSGNAAATPDRRTEAEKSRDVFARFLADPAAVDVKSADVAEFFGTTARTKSLRSATQTLWDLRERLKPVAAVADASSDVVRARRNLKTVETTFAESLAETVRTIATGDEIAELRADLSRRLSARDADSSFSFSIVTACGFTDLEERYYRDIFANNPDDDALRSLISFYRRRGDLDKIATVLATEIDNRQDEFVKIFAENAKLLGNARDESKALGILSQRNSLEPALRERFLSLLYQNDRPAFEAIADATVESPGELVGFLLQKKEFTLAVKTIRNSPLDRAAKLHTIARINRFGEINDESAEAVFDEANLKSPIGRLIESDPQDLLAPPDWFRLAGDYAGLLETSGRFDEAAQFALAQNEFAPRDAARQFTLGYDFHKRGDFIRAAEHFEIALELTDRADEYLPYAGAARFALGQTEKALGHWSRLAEPDSPDSSVALYVRTLHEFGLGERARKDVRRRLVEALKESGSEAKSFAKTFEAIAATFADDLERASYFRELAAEAPRDRSLAAMVIKENLVLPDQLADFYEIVIKRSHGLSSYDMDYRYEEILRESFDERVAEILCDLRTDFAPQEPESERLAAQRDFLLFLLERGDNGRAGKVVREIEESLAGKFARPVWLRLADLRIQLAEGDHTRVFDELLLFTAIKLPDAAGLAILPNLERLDFAEKMLAESSSPGIQTALREAFYARLLAVGQFSNVNFLELAKMRFIRGDSPTALIVLRNLAEMPTAKAKAETANIPIVAAFADRNRLAFDELVSGFGSRRLADAAELAAEFGEIEFATQMRRDLSAAAPEDRDNLIELARLEAYLGRFDSAAKTLTEIVADRTATRKNRWQAMLVSEEIARENAALRNLFDRSFSALQSVDGEIISARQALTGKQTDEAAESAEARFLRCAIARNANRPSECFAETAFVNSSLAETFGPFEMHPLLGLVNDQLNASNFSFALSLAKSSIDRGEFKTMSIQPTRKNQFPTLQRRATARFNEDLRRMLRPLSIAAEREGDFAFAIELETFRTALETESAEVNRRLESLRARLAETEAAASRVPRF